MPDFDAMSDSQSYDIPSAGSFDAANLNPSDVQNAAVATQPTHYSAATTLLGDAALGVSDLVDTVASSIPGVSSSLGIKRGDFNQDVLNVVGLPGLSNFYQENKGGIEVASSVYGIIGAELATGGLISAAAPLVSAWKGATWAKKALSLDKTYEAAIANVKAVDIGLAARGELGAAQYVQAAEILPHFNVGGAIETGTQAVSMTRAAASSSARWLGFGKGVARAAASEAVMATTLNQNSFLYSSDEGANIAFGALGLGLGGAFGLAGASYAIRKFANSDQIQRLNAAAFDPTGLERKILDGGNVAKKFAEGGAPDTYLGALGGSTTDRITALQVMATAKPTPGVNVSNAEMLNTQRLSLIKDESQKVFIKGIRGVPGSAASYDAEGVGSHWRQFLGRDPGGALQAEMIGWSSENQGISKMWQDHVEHLDARKAALDESLSKARADPNADPDEIVRMQGEMKQVNWMKTHVPVPVIDGEATTMGHAASYENWFEPTIRTGGDRDLKTWEAIGKTDGKPFKVGLDSDMSVYLPGKKTLQTADHFDILRLYRAAQNMTTDILRDPAGVLKLPEKPNWFQLDMAENMLQKGGPDRVQFPGTMTRESAQVESFAQKVDALGASKLTDDPTDIAKLRVRYNLPMLTAHAVGMLGTEEHPVDMLVRGALAKGGGDAVRGTPLQDLVDGITQSGKITDLLSDNGKSARNLLGNSMNFLRDADGNATTPFLMIKRPFAPQEYVKDNLAERIAARKVDTIQRLTDERADPLTQMLAANTIGNQDFALASNVSGLSDIQLQAVVPGLGNKAPGQGVRGFTDGLTTVEWKMRDTATMQAMTRIRETTERVSQAYMRETFERELGSTLSTLNGPRNTESKVLLDQFHSYANGWELPDLPLKMQLPGGKDGYQFVLEDTAGNRARFKQQFGRDMAQGEVLPTPQGKPVVLDQMALDAQMAFNRISDIDRVQKNVLKSALGLPETRRANWYVPAPNPEGKFVGYTYDTLGNPVPGGTVMANTQEQFQRMVARLKDPSVFPDSPLLREGHEFRTLKATQDYASAMDRAQQEMVNPGRTFIAPEKGNYGGSAGQEFNTNAFQDSLSQMRDSFLQHGRDVHAVLFDDAIKAAKTRSAITNADVAGSISETQKQKGKSMYDLYVQEATGASPLKSERSWFGRKYNELEGSTNTFLADSVPKAIDAIGKSPPGQLLGQVRDYFRQANPYSMTNTEKQAFQDMAASLGPYMPFNSVAAKIEAQGMSKVPPTLAGITGSLNRFESTWVLRMLEPVQAAMNLGGMLNASPAVMRFLSHRAGETAEDYAARVGHSAQIFDSDSGRQFGVLDMGKMMWRGFKRSWNRTADPEFDYMAQNGHLDFQMAEFRKAFNAAENRSGWDRFMNGDPGKAAQGGAGGKFYDKGLVGWLSVITDKSEDFSRSWGHMMGLELAESLGIADKAAKHGFAHDVANKLIANYSPANRPEVFQGAVGAPIGLFQSFIWAYYQRLFRYVETGDKGALAAQYAAQAGLFGFKTVPGFQEVNQFMFNGHDGKDSPYDSIVHRFGQGAGDVLMAGTMGNLPTLFGAPGGTGIDLASRGDTSFRTPVFNVPPTISTALKLKQGISQAIGLFSGRNPGMSHEQLAEIVSNTMPNRPMAGMIEQAFTNGDDTDSMGQVINHTHGALESMYRIMGSRSTRQSQEIEAFYSNKGAQEIKAGQDGLLRANTRSFLRANPDSMDGLPQIFETYVANGGRPEQYKRWLKEQYVAATQTRGERQLHDLMRSKSGDYSDRINRLMDSQVSMPDEDAAPILGNGPPDSMDSPTPTNSFADNTDMMYGNATQ